MKKIIIFFSVVSLLLTWLVANKTSAAPCTPGYGGGTGICNATSGQVLYLLQVSSSSPLTYQLVATSSLGITGGGGSSTQIVGIYPINITALLAGVQTSSCPTCQLTTGVTSTYVVVGQGAQTTTGYSNFTYDGNLLTLPSGTVSSNLVFTNNGSKTAPNLHWNDGGGDNVGFYTGSNLPCLVWGLDYECEIMNGPGRIQNKNYLLEWTNNTASLNQGFGALGIDLALSRSATNTLAVGANTTVGNASGSILLFNLNAINNINASGTISQGGSAVAISGGLGVNGNCVKWTGANTITDQGAPCGSGGSGITTLATTTAAGTFTTQVSGANATITIPSAHDSFYAPSSYVTSLANNSAAGGIDFSAATGASITGVLHSLAITQFTGILGLDVSNTNTTSTNLYAVNQTNTGTTTLATTSVTKFTNSGVKSALVLNDSNGLEGAYGGASACGSNQAVTTISAVGATTCAAFLTTGNAFANPSQLFDGATHNGSASTAMRSDAIPGFATTVNGTSTTFTIGTTTVNDFTNVAVKSALTLADSSGHQTAYTGSSVNAGANCLTSVTSSAAGVLTGANTGCLTGTKVDSIGGVTGAVTLGAGLYMNGQALNISSSLALVAAPFNYYDATTTQPYNFIATPIGTTTTITLFECHEFATATTTWNIYVATTTAQITTNASNVIASIACGPGGNSTTTFTSSTFYKGEQLVASTTAIAGTPTWTYGAFYGTKQ